jgi:murein DD-endopeptidase MepM/ murein hydrolase activator NlpD
VSKRRRSFTVLVAGGDGRVVRLHLGSRTLYAGLALLALVAVGGGVALSDYSMLARQRHEVASLHHDLRDRRSRLEADDQRFADMQKEIATWNEVHTRIWRPFGEAPAIAAATDDSSSGSLLATVQEAGKKLRALEQVVNRSARVLAAVPQGRPVRARINSGFGRRPSPWGEGIEFHRGIDLAADPGTPVKATAPGIVTFAGKTPDYGNTIVVDHGGDIKTRFGHLHKIHIASGERVERGQEIALSGNTGRSTGPHLHYELLLQGRPIDPKLSFDE